MSTDWELPVASLIFPLGFWNLGAFQNGPESPNGQRATSMLRHNHLETTAEFRHFRWLPF